MEKVSIEDVEPQAMGDADRRALADPLSTTGFAINRYRLEPDERFSGGLHAHMDQEEVFVVVEGEAAFERPDDDDVTVAAGEAVRFAPGEFQSGYNAGDEPVVAFAMGAPRNSEDVRVPQECPECGNDDMRAIPAEDGEGFDLECPECGTQIAGD